MKLVFDSINIRLFADNNFENKILKSDYLKTKLAYIFSDKYDKFLQLGEVTDISTLNILFRKGNSLLDFDNGYASINENLSEQEICYILRIILDAFVVKKNSLPLHGAMLSNREKGAFVFGDTKCGKSTICNNIINFNKDFKVIGDDHVIVNHESIIGNSICRLRSTVNTEHDCESISEKQLLINNEIYSPVVKDYIIFDININHKNNYFNILNGNEYLDKNLSYILKYLTDDFYTSSENIFISNFIDKKIKEKYLYSFDHFIKNSYKIVKIRGNQNYVTSIINNYLVNL